ncbi:MAG: hypothetical protein MZU91_12810 [Desulfosudis oleivorans]|nr:hypothetical protein [Desulfosudis oleivorans]
MKGVPIAHDSELGADSRTHHRDRHARGPARPRLLGRGGRALPRQQRAALRDRAHRIGARPAGRRTQPQRHARHRAHADQLGLAAHAGRPRHRRARSLRPLHQHPRRRLDPRRQRPAPRLHVGCGRCLQRRQSRLAPRLRRQGPPPPAQRRRQRTSRSATAPPVPPSPEATTEHRWSQPCPDRSPEHFLSTQPRDTTP